MDLSNIKIDLRDVNEWIKDRFPNRDLITFEELLGDYESLITELEEIEEAKKDLETDIENNYRRIEHSDPYEDRYI